MRVVLCDVGLGNLRSVERALTHAAEEAGVGGSTAIERVTRPEELARGDAVVFPGQGGFGACAAALAKDGMGEALRERIRAGVRYVGICLGMQILFESSEEAEGSPGLALYAGAVKRLAPGEGRKVPHCGWNQVEPSPGGTRLFGAAGSAAPWFYFVHSYVVVPRDASLVCARTTYGDAFVSAVAKDNVFACQFHPEKSQRAGIDLLRSALFS